MFYSDGGHWISKVADWRDMLVIFVLSSSQLHTRLSLSIVLSKFVRGETLIHLLNKTVTAFLKHIVLIVGVIVLVLVLVLVRYLLIIHFGIVHGI